MTNASLSSYVQVKKMETIYVQCMRGFQGYEDWQRHKSDYEINNSEAYVIRRGISMKVRSMDLRVGDIIKVMDNSSIPCDMLLLSSTNADGRCHITSVNLDGETNLKVRASTVD